MHWASEERKYTVEVFGEYSFTPGKVSLNLKTNKGYDLTKNVHHHLSDGKRSELPIIDHIALRIDLLELFYFSAGDLGVITLQRFQRKMEYGVQVSYFCV
jgi:hypothetical protein